MHQRLSSNAGWAMDASFDPTTLPFSRQLVGVIDGEGYDLCIRSEAPMRTLRFRLHLLIVLAIGLLVASFIGASAQTGTPEASEPESCLRLETFAVPAGHHPHDVAPAADGTRVWYTAQGAGALGLLDPTTGAIETIPLGDGSAPHGVIVGPDGAAWVTDGGLNAIVRVDQETLTVEVWPVGGDHANLNTPVFDLDGVLWFTGQAGVVGRLDPTTQPPGTVLETVAAPRGRGPYGITVTPDGEIWFASLAGNYLGHVVQDSGNGFTLDVIEPPTPAQGTRRVWSDSAGVLWTSEWNAGQVGRYDPASGEWMEWRLPGDAPQAYAVFVDERDDVWLSDFGANALVRFDPDTEQFASLPLPDGSAQVRQIHGRPSEVWGAESAVDKLVAVYTNCP
jgi:virginiamycin B lyase